MNKVIWLLWIVAPIFTFQTTSSDPETLFRNLFRIRRNEQTIAVKNIIQMDNESKQKKMLLAVMEKIFFMIMKNKRTLVRSEFIPGVSDFPDEEYEEVRDAIFTLMTNLAFVGDLIIVIPYLSQPILNVHKEWISVLQWSIDFAIKTNLMDEPTSKLLILVEQEMNFTERSENYKNPYRKLRPHGEKQTVVTAEQKKKKKIARGPRLSYNAEL